MVRDTGVGIASEDVERLFDRFYRADNVRGRSVEGAGIGLSLVRGLVELTAERWKSRANRAAGRR